MSLMNFVSPSNIKKKESDASLDENTRQNLIILHSRSDKSLKKKRIRLIS